MWVIFFSATRRADREMKLARYRRVVYSDEFDCSFSKLGLRRCEGVRCDFRAPFETFSIKIVTVTNVEL